MAYTQANSPIAVTTPLGTDKLLLIGFTGHESISQLFQFQLDVVADNGTARDLLKANNSPFSGILGQSITVEIRLRGRKRYVNGICIRVTQGLQDDAFTDFRLEIAPKMWLLTKAARSKIFQTMTVPDILGKVFTGLDVAYQWNNLGAFKKRDYCVQYRETDFNFASRFMEEEGIHYYFKHTQSGHQLCVADFPGHPSIFDGATAPVVFARNQHSEFDATTELIYDWQKSQEVRSGKYTLRDHSFELQTPGQPVFVEGTATSADLLQVGTMNHTLKLANNTTALEVYDYPGEFAQRFDGVDPGGGARAADLQNIAPDGTRTAGIRMEEETSHAVVITGNSNCPLFSAGRNFTRTDQDKTKDQILKNDGEYLLVGVTHFAKASDYRTSSTAPFTYYNSFACVPSSATARRTPRQTPKPIIQGPHTATVVGQSGTEIFTDKYGRVKVQFHWDRDGKIDANSSCWVRVAQAWSGKLWGATFWPRIGQEVLVAFLEGDPDQPIIVGSVYNSVQMPPYVLPDNQNLTGVKSNTTLGGVGFNEWRFNDTKGKEQIFFHAERNMDTRVKNDLQESVINNRSLIVGLEKDGNKSGDQMEKVFQDKHLHVMRDQQEKIEGNYVLTVGHGNAASTGVQIVIEKDKFELIEGQSELHVKDDGAVKFDKQLCLTVGENLFESVGGKADLSVTGNLQEKIGGDHSLNVTGKFQHKVGTNHAVDAGTEIYLKGGQKVIIEAGTQISLKVGGNFIDISSSGINIVGTLVGINSGGSAGSGSACSTTDPAAPKPPNDATQAAPVDPTVADDATSGQKSAPS